MLCKLCAGMSMLGFVFITSAQDSDEQPEQESQTKRPSWSAGMPEREKSAALNKPQFNDDDNSLELDMSEFGIKPKSELKVEIPISELEILPVGESVADEAVGKQAEVEISKPEISVNTAPDIVENEIILTTPVVKVKEQENTKSAIQQNVTSEPLITEPLVDDKQEPIVVESPVAESDVNDSSAVSNEELNGANSVILEPAVNVSNSNFIESAATQLEYEWKIIRQTPVDYPPRAAADNLEGWVDVEITINPAGEVISASPVDYSRRGRVFGKPALDAVNEWLFDAPEKLGISSNLTRIYKIEFDL